MRARSACHGSTGFASSSSTAKKPATCGPSAPSAASVPAAPPSCAGSRSRSSRSRLSARVDRDQPSGRLETERRRHRLLQQRPRRHRRQPVRLGEPRRTPRPPRRAPRRSARAPAGRRASPRCRRCPGSSRRNGRSPAASPPTTSRSARTSGSAGLPDSAARLDDRLDVEALDPAGLGDRPRQVRRNDAGERLGVRERPLDLEHRLDPGAIRHRRADLLRHEDRVEGHSAKNTVSSGPWRWMSKRSEPSGSGTATSVERRPSSTPESTGSAAFASASSGKYIRVTTRLRSPRANTLTREMRRLTVRAAPGLTASQLEAAVAGVAAAEAARPAPRSRPAHPGLAPRRRRARARGSGRRRRRIATGPRRDVQERPDRLRRRDRAHSSWSSSSNGVEREHDVEDEPERLVGDRRLEIEPRDQPLARLRVADRAEDRVVGEQRIVREVHLRHEPLRERATEQREVDVRRAPGVRMVRPRIAAGLHRHEPVSPLRVGEAAPGAVEVRVERRIVAVGVVAVAAGRVRLPDLDQRVAYGPSVILEHAPADDDPLTLRPAVVAARQIVVGLGQVVAVDRCAEIPQCQRQEQQRTRRARAAAWTRTPRGDRADRRRRRPQPLRAVRPSGAILHRPEAAQRRELRARSAARPREACRTPGAPSPSRARTASASTPGCRLVSTSSQVPGSGSSTPRSVITAVTPSPEKPSSSRLPIPSPNPTVERKSSCSTNVRGDCVSITKVSWHDAAISGAPPPPGSRTAGCS